MDKNNIKSGKQTGQKLKSKSQEKKDKLAVALRENLRRRKVSVAPVANDVSEPK